MGHYVSPVPLRFLRTRYADITGAMRTSVPCGKSGIASLSVQEAPPVEGLLSLGVAPPLPAAPVPPAKLAAKIPVTVLDVAPKVARIVFVTTSFTEPTVALELVNVQPRSEGD